MHRVKVPHSVYPKAACWSEPPYQVNNLPGPDCQSVTTYLHSWGVVSLAGHVVPVAHKVTILRVQSAFQLLCSHHGLGSSV